MTRIRCRERRCTFNKNGICTSDEIEYEPDAGCLTMEAREDASDNEEAWEDEDLDADLEEELEDEEDEADEDEEWEDESDDQDEFYGKHPRKR